MATAQGRLFYLEFVAALLLFIIYISEYISFSFYYYLPGFVYTVIFLVYVVLYLLHRENPSRYGSLFHILFGAMLVLFVALFLMPKTVFNSEVTALGITLRIVGIYMIFLLFLYFVFALGAYAYNVARRKKVAIVIFILGTVMSLIFFSYVVTSFQFGDETLLAFNAVGQFLEGYNPYTVSISNQIYSNFSVIGGSVTTNNNFIGVMDYPALYFITLIPFYFASPPTLQNLANTDLGLEAAVYLVLLFLAIVYVADKKRVMEFKLEIVIFLAFALGSMASIAGYLMLALLLIAYAKLESRYAFIPIGLAFSIQQEVWLPAALLLLYSFNNYGWRKGARDLLGALAVFLLINGYFITMNPAAFFSDVLLPIGNAMPFNASPIAYLFLVNYHVLLPLTGILIIAATVIVALFMLYWNRKEMIPILSLIPLFFMFHTLSGYYTFYLFFLVFVLVVCKNKEGKGWITPLLRRYKVIFCSAILLTVAAAGVCAYQSHLEYASTFGFAVENQSVSFTGNSTIYDASLVYHNMSNSTLFFYLQGYSDNGAQYLLYGIHNESLIGTAPQCGSVQCLLNVNRIELPGNGTVYHLHAVINGSNATSRVAYMHAIFYNGRYVYETYPVQNQSA